MWTRILIETLAPAATIVIQGAASAPADYKSSAFLHRLTKEGERPFVQLLKD